MAVPVALKITREIDRYISSNELLVFLLFAYV